MPSNYNLSDVADSYGLWSYNDDLIYYATEDHENWQHRELVLRKDKNVRIYICRLDEEIFSEKPITTPDIFGGQQEKEKEELSLMNGDRVIDDATPIDIDEFEIEEGSGQDISKEWDKEKWDALLVKIFNKARVHSYSVIQLYDAPPYWRVFCDREITQIYYDDNDIPIRCDVSWSRNKPYTDKFDTFKETIDFYTPGMELTDLDGEKGYGMLIPFGIGESEDVLGEFDLEDKWTLLISLRYSGLDVTNNSAKSSGFYWLKYGHAISPTTKAYLDKAFDMAGGSSAVGAKESVLAGVEAMFPAKPEFTIDALAEFTRQFAAACRLPLTYFRSESEKGSMFGDMSGDEIQINKKKMFIFGRFKPYIMDLIYMRWGIELDDIEPFLYEAEEEEIDVPMEDEKETKKEEIIK